MVDDVWAAAEELGYSAYFARGNGPNLIDDHVAIQKAGIGAIDVVDFDYPWWHTPDDTIDKVSEASLKMVATSRSGWCGGCGESGVGSRELRTTPASRLRPLTPDP